MGKWRESGSEGRKEDPRVEICRITRSPLFLFCFMYKEMR